MRDLIAIGREWRSDDDRLGRSLPGAAAICGTDIDNGDHAAPAETDEHLVMPEATLALTVTRPAAVRGRLLVRRGDDGVPTGGSLT